MSKWTLEKILACDEIKFGTKLSLENKKYYQVRVNAVLIQKTQKDGLDWIVEGELDITGLCNDEDVLSVRNVYESIVFYDDSGTEILPPKDKKKIKIEGYLVYYKDSVSGRYKAAYFESEYSAQKQMELCHHGIIYERFEREIEVIDNE